MPMALLFGIPILASVVLVYFISPDWYTKISKSVSRVTITIVIAVLISVFFFAFLRMQVKWEMNEQSYQELKAKLRKSEAADNEKKTS